MTAGAHHTKTYDVTTGSSDNASTCIGYWPPGLLHTLGPGGHI